MQTCDISFYDAHNFYYTTSYFNHRAQNNISTVVVLALLF